MRISNKAILFCNDSKTKTLIRASLTSEWHLVTMNALADAPSANDLENIAKTDLLFVDIDMLLINGSKIIAGFLERFDFGLPVVLIAQSNEYAIQAIRWSVFDYLVKPINAGDIHNLLSRLAQWKRGGQAGLNIAHRNHSLTEKIRINTRTGFLFISLDKILYCLADCNYTQIILTSDIKEIVSLNLGAIEAMINNACFYRLSRSVLINMKYFVGIDRKRKACILESCGKRIYVNVPINKLRILERKITQT